MELKKNNRYQNVNEFLDSFEPVSNDKTYFVSSVPYNSPTDKPSKKPIIKKIIFIVLGLLLGSIGAYWLTKYFSARGDKPTYYSYINIVENIIQDLKANEKEEPLLVADYERAQRCIDEICGLEIKHRYFYPYSRYHWLDLDVSLDDAWNEFVDNNPFVVKDIQFANIDKDCELIDDYGSTLHASEIYYLAARLEIISKDGGFFGTLQVKFFFDGILSQAYDSPSDYSYSHFVVIPEDESYDLPGWGSEDGGSYTGVSTVRCEIWHDNKKIAEKTITLL